MSLQLLDTMDSQQKIFGAWLRERRKEQRLTVDGLAKRAGISKQYLSLLERAAPHALTGKAIRPKVEIVDKLSKALGLDLDEARIAAGYAPTHPQTFKRPTNVDELKAILQSLGVDLLASGGLENRSQEYFQDLIEDLARFLNFRIANPPLTIRELEFSNDDDETITKRSRKLG